MFHVKPPSGALGFLEDAIEGARADGLLRERGEPLPAAAGPGFDSNDYLGLAWETAVSANAGSGASRLLGGDHPIHRELEAESARLVSMQDALVFSSGYAANLGLLACLAGPSDVIVSDALNHASIIDGARLSRARVVVVPHLDVDAVDAALAAPRAGRAFVVTESYFSMDADIPDLAHLRESCDRHGAALIVDEAHALGVLGPQGKGLCAKAGIRPDVLIGTYGKAFGAAGAFVAGSKTLTTWCWNRARSFVFSTAMSPGLAATALNGLRRAEEEPHRRERVLSSARRLRAGMAALGLSVPGEGPILPWHVGEARKAVELASDLSARGMVARAVRPPTVPPGTSRLRLTVTARHTAADLEKALATITAVVHAG